MYRVINKRLLIWLRSAINIYVLLPFAATLCATNTTKLDGFRGVRYTKHNDKHSDKGMNATILEKMMGD